MTMKYLSMAALLMAGVAFTSCSSDDDAIAEPQQSENAGPKTYTLTIMAGKGGDAAGIGGTRALTPSGGGLTATWNTSETVEVFKEIDDKLTKVGILNPEENAVRTMLSGTITVDKIKGGDELTLAFCNTPEYLERPAYNSQIGTLADIAAHYDYAKATCTVSSANSTSIVTSENDVVFQNQQAIICFNLQDAAGHTLDASSLTVTDATSTVSLTIPSTTYTTNGSGVVYVAFPATGEVRNITLNATVSEGTYAGRYTYTQSDVTFTNGKFYNVTVKMNVAP